MKKTQAATATMSDLLNQQKWWRAKAIGPVKLKDMDTRHKANTLAWLLTHADEIVSREYVRLAYTDAPNEVVESVGQADPLAWMLSQPLVQALTRHLAGSTGALIAPADPDPDIARREIARREIAAFDNGATAAIQAVRRFGEKRSTAAARMLVEQCCDRARHELMLDNG